MSANLHISDYVQKWSSKGLRPLGAETDESFEDLYRQIEYLSNGAFSRFIPAILSKHSPVFLDRFSKWLSNETLTEEDQIALFQLITRISYFSFDDFLCFYQTAFSDPICRWLWNQLNLSMEDPQYQEVLHSERYEKTWYASVTDSFLLSEFYHVNSLSAIESRPDFKTLKDFGDIEKLITHMSEHDFKRIVLLEDFVGSGTQASGVLNWILENLDVPVLFCPMLMCPDGHRRLSKIADASSGRLAIEPVVILGGSAFLSSRDPDDLLMAHLAELNERVFPQVLGQNKGFFGEFSARFWG